MTGSRGSEPRRWGRGWRRGLLRAALVGLGLVIVALTYVGVVAIRHSVPAALPAPVGAYPVGRVERQLTDDSRRDPTDPLAGPRRLAVWIWYPASRTGPGGASGPTAPYAPGPWAALHFSGPVGVAEQDFARLRTHSVADAAPARSSFPVVVLEPGLGFSALQYTSIAESLASSGFVVAGVTPTHSANLTVLDGHAVGRTPAGDPPNLGSHRGEAAHAADRLVNTWAADARFVADRLGSDAMLGRHVDADRLYLGHSFGGAAALQACQQDRRCRGAVDLDGTQFGAVVHTGLRVPTMLMESGNSCITGTCGPAVQDDPDDRAAAQSLVRASTGPVFCYSLAGTEHFNFTDYGAYYLAYPLRKLLPLGSINGDHALNLVNAYLTAFAVQSTGGPPQALLRHGQQVHPDVIVQPGRR